MIHVMLRNHVYVSQCYEVKGRQWADRPQVEASER